MGKRSSKDADAPKRLRKSSTGSTKKKKSKAEEVLEEEEEPVEDEDIAMVCGDEDAEEVNEQEANDEEEDEEAGEEEKTELSDARKAAIKRATNARAKQKGYRIQATRAGIGKNNMLLNISGVQDVRRAAKFRPLNLNSPCYPLEEFKRRLALSITPLPESAASALVPYFEKLQRSLVEDAVARMLPTGSQTLKASHLVPSVAGIEENGDFSFLFPDGLRTFAQVVDRRGKPISLTGEPPLVPANAADVDRTKTDKAIQSKMKALVKEADALLKKAKETRVERIKKAKEARAAASEVAVEAV